MQHLHHRNAINFLHLPQPPSSPLPPPPCIFFHAFKLNYRHFSNQTRVSFSSHIPLKNSGSLQCRLDAGRKCEEEEDAAGSVVLCNGLIIIMDGSPTCVAGVRRILPRVDGPPQPATIRPPACRFSCAWQPSWGTSGGTISLSLPHPSCWSREPSPLLHIF